MTLNNNKSFLNKTEKLAKELAIKTFSASDTMQYFVIQPNSFYYKMQDLLLNSVPIPDFRFGSDFANKSDTIENSMLFDLYFSNDFPCGLTKDYEIYVIRIRLDIVTLLFDSNFFRVLTLSFTSNSFAFDIKI